MDAYAAYKGLARDQRAAGAIRLAFCLAHARRKFVAIVKTTNSPLAREVVERIAATSRRSPNSESKTSSS